MIQRSVRIYVIQLTGVGKKPASSPGKIISSKPIQFQLIISL